MKKLVFLNLVLCVFVLIACNNGILTDDLPSATEHNCEFGSEWKTDLNNHWHECECGEKTEVAAHIWDEGVVTVQPTESSKGKKVYTCTICGQTKEEVISLNHVHKYGSNWETDSSNHWHECECGEKTEVAAHTWDEGVVTVQPTESSKGKKVYTCTVCEQTKEEELDMLEHTHKYGSDWETDSSNHWHECECGGKTEVAAHTWDEGVVTVEPTYSSQGEKVYTCTVCEQTKEEVLDKLKQKVNVIILAGQSNAVGQSYAYHLSEEDLTKYRAGFENVQIRYELNPFATTESIHINDTFEPVKLGQGKGVDWGKYPDGCIGPELGIAQYLSENYPNEQFYIIKSATGGTTLHDRWYSTSSLEYLGKTGFEDNSLYVQLLSFVDESMEMLKEEYDPEIFSLCWMQGENDAKDYSLDYEILWTNFINDLKSEWGQKDYLADNGLSVVDAGITNYWTNFDVINGIKEKYAAMSSKNHYIDVVTDPEITAFKDNTDYAHLDVYAMLKLGNEFGKKLGLAYNDLGNVEVVYDVPRYENNKWNGIDISIALQGEGTIDNPYLITSAADMAYFAESVKTNNYANKYVKLTVYLDMSNYAFKGIGNGDYNVDASKYEYSLFAGTFDGDNHTIKVNIVKNYAAGLFAAVSGTVKNVNVSGSIRCVYRCAGSIAAIQEGGLIENCTNNAIVTSKYYTPGNGNVGGIVGYLKTGNIKGCTNNGDVYGYVNAYSDNQGVGGIVGTIVQNATGTILGCTNNGFVYNKGYCTGGIIGVNRGKYEVSNCINTATVIGEKSLVGGIMGVTNFSANTIVNCENCGDVKGATFVGGIIGSLGYDGDRASTVSNCTNSGNVEATATTATIGKDVKAGSRVGGIVGMAFGSKVENCTNTGDVKCPTMPESLEEWQNKEPYIGLIVGYKTTNATVTNNN